MTEGPTTPSRSVAELRAEREKLAAILASLDREGDASGNPGARERQRAFLQRRLVELDRQIGPVEGEEA